MAIASLSTMATAMKPVMPMSELTVETGEVLEQSQVVGYAGSTGNSTGPHLHFETIYNGELQNPMGFF